MSAEADEATGAPGKIPLIHLYIDETGSRHLDRPGAQAKHGFDWFAIGGLLVDQEHEDGTKQRLQTFLARWPQIRSPLHFTDMRAEKKGFSWLGRVGDETRTRFWSEYKMLLAAAPVAGTACVIDRPGYAARGYGKRIGEEKWLLCRSAFDIILERAAKYAKHRGRRLRVYYERADPDTDARVEDYFRNIKAKGLAFDEKNSAKYNPMKPDEFAHLLLDITGKDKSNKMMQVADTYLYSITRGSYERKFDIYRRLLESGRLVTSQVPGAMAANLGIKTYCFELVAAARNNKSRV
ncbi:hypothetical protein ABID58_000698 [Bradyrhizobium sp. S3.2.6]|uniref:DUF3800 domain-containing protein n=1 Tax=Bradyrhizobium sp. S3.2.6 TaxID=3156428 RepID=UPI00339367FD